MGGVGNAAQSMLTPNTYMNLAQTLSDPQKTTALFAGPGAAGMTPPNVSKPLTQPSPGGAQMMSPKHADQLQPLIVQDSGGGGGLSQDTLLALQRLLARRG